MKFGYAFVSTEHPNLVAQLHLLRRAGCKSVFTDERSSVKTKRPALRRCLKAMQPGDMLMVWQADRLADNSGDRTAIIKDLSKRGVKFRSLTEACSTTPRLKKGRKSKLLSRPDFQEMTGWSDYKNWLTG